jgi:hypothetical protein
MGSVLGPTQVLWQSVLNPYAGGNAFRSFDGGSYSAQATQDQAFLLRGDVAGVPEPGSIIITAAGLALLGVLRIARRRSPIPSGARQSQEAR